MPFKALPILKLGLLNFPQFFFCLFFGFFFLAMLSEAYKSSGGLGLNLSHSSDNVESLTPKPPGNSSISSLYAFLHMFSVLEVFADTFSFS